MWISRAHLGGAAVLLSVALTAAGCATLTVNSFAERGVDLQRYLTFNWGPSATFSTGDPRLDNNRFVDERLRTQIERELASRGFEKTTSEPPDVLVHYHVSVRQEIDIRTLDHGDESCDEAGCERYVYDAGSLFIDFVEPGTGRLVWRGWAEGSVDGLIDSQERLEERIDEAVARILDLLPRRLVVSLEHSTVWPLRAVESLKQRDPL
jgi:hypothetical protein